MDTEDLLMLLALIGAGLLLALLIVTWIGRKRLKKAFRQWVSKDLVDKDYRTSTYEPSVDVPPEKRTSHDPRPHP